ncbi:MAG: hydroxymethylbilane synthase [Planctomycetes bacterium]|nr:hydroxymethylbilane synthase [Planctomycetota bacterium]MBL7007940.1 hydroxymethylbilane synthase [Planctomycetota bacterium]
MRTLRLATRGSDLARTQSGAFADALQHATGVPSELVIIKTQGDRVQDVALADAGSIGLFTAEVQSALLDGRADYAVHSLKDLPAEQTAGLRCGAVPLREDSCDWLIVRPSAFEPARHELPIRAGSRVGTSAARRVAFCKATDPACRPELLRGNVPTRVRKLAEGQYDAILLAAAGLRRLGTDLSEFKVVPLPYTMWPGAPGQGALSIECRADDDDTFGLLRTLHDPEAALEIEAERTLLRALGGGCGLPLGARAELIEGGIRLMAAFGPTPDRPGAPPLVRAEVEGADPAAVAAAAREVLLAPAGRP